MEQTEESIVAYMKLQDWMYDKSEAFTKKWQEILWKYPELDYSQAHPTNSRAILVKREQDAKKLKNKLKLISDDYGLFFVFRSDCPFCHKMAPIIKSFAAKNNFAVFPISQDGVGLPEYPKPRADNGLSKRMHITRVPAVFLVNPKRRDIIPVSFGLLSQSELTNRLISITNKLGVTQ
jgi:conjugal transfer pilus assembly protein TraF